jgi:hypothetical protein
MTATVANKKYLMTSSAKSQSQIAVSPTVAAQFGSLIQTPKRDNKVTDSARSEHRISLN